MIYTNLPDENIRDVSFYLAMEEYMARHKNEDDYFLMWQVMPSVIFGRNQLIENEVNMDFCRSHGISTYRRKSGGGCVYADRNNVMFSFITKDEGVRLTFNRYINMVVLMLRKLGIEANANGRNDILIGNRKVSGNAFYHLPGRSIVHGTMLFDTDMTNMVGSITPTDEKLLSKGVKSVRQRIALLKDYTDISIEEFKSFVRKNLCERELTLTEADIAAIKEMEKEYRSDRFIYGNNPKYTEVRKQRVEGAGDFEIRIERKNDVIRDINIMGDFFLVGDMDGKIIKRLQGVRMNRQAVMEALPERVDDIIMNLSKEDLVDMILND